MLKKLLAWFIIASTLSTLAWGDDYEAIQKKAKQGDIEAQSDLGYMYFKGIGVPQDYSKALKWSRMAGERGHAVAQVILGIMYHSGEGVSQDYKTAAKWLRLAAEQGNSDAQAILGNMYATGKGVSQDFSESYFWLSLASQCNSVAARGRDAVANKLSLNQRLKVHVRCSNWLATLGKNLR